MAAMWSSKEGDHLRFPHRVGLSKGRPAELSGRGHTRSGVTDNARAAPATLDSE